MSKISVGDRVKYSAKFLRSIGAYTGELPFAKGTVREISHWGTLTVARVEWGNPEIPEGVNVGNLTLCGRPEAD